MKVGVIGAGAIGCYVGGLLAHSGAEVVLVGRKSLQDAAQGRIQVKTLQDAALDVAVTVATEPTAVADCDVVLVCVKSRDTAAVGAQLADVCRAERVAVVSLQNGVANPAALRAALPADRFTVLAGMVEWNVVWSDGPLFHRTTEGDIYVELLPDAPHEGLALATALRDAGVSVRRSEEMLRVQWSKLLINLLNSVNAAANISTYDTLMTPGYRVVWGALLAEGLAVLRKRGIAPLPQKGVPPVAMTYVLTLPTWAFKLVARSATRIDRRALQSMAQDLRRGRPTEAPYLNGAVVELGREVGVPTPLNEAMLRVIAGLEGGAGDHSLSPEELMAALGMAPPSGLQWYHAPLVGVGVGLAWALRS